MIIILGRGKEKGGGGEKRENRKIEKERKANR